MFDNLSERLQGTFKKLRGQARITEENITQALRDVRMALIEADVALPVVKEVIETIKNAAIGQEVSLKLSPDQAFIKTVKNELVRIMGEENSALNLATQPPAVILMAGLQGSGKTTSSAKLARKLINEKKKVALVSADVYRPAAIEQLKTLAGQVGATFIPSDASEKPADITARAYDFAKRQYFDVLIVDTAGRLHIDDALMDEIRTLHAQLKPIETLFVVDSMTGQDAANIIEGSQGIVHAETRDGDLYFSCTLPNLIVGTVGNGKGATLATVEAHLQALGCREARPAGENARRLAAICAATVLCGELSLLAAQTNPGELMRAHLALERRA